MNKTELREMDAWIAEHVMDAKRFVGVKKGGYWYRPDAHGYTAWESEAWHLTREEAKKHEYRRGDDPVIICEFSIPLYTTDPAAAMEVLKQIMSKTGVRLGTERAGEFTCGDNADIVGFETGPTIEIAICKFARKLFTK